MRTVISRAFVVAAAIALLGMLGGLGLLPHASAVGTIVSGTSASAQVGDPVKVTVAANAVADPGLGAWTIDLQYNTTVISVTDCVADHGGICNAYYRKDTVRVTGTSVVGLPGDVSLVSIGFMCKNAGSSGTTPIISVLADATIGHPETIAATTSAGAVTCTAVPVPTATSAPTPTPTPPSSEKVPGDADCDHNVTAVDAALILQYTAGLIHSVPCPGNADVNHDGVINAVDAALVLQIVVGIV